MALTLHTLKCDYPGCVNNRMYGSRCIEHGGAGYGMTTDERFAKHVSNVLRDDRQRYRLAGFSLLLGRWYPRRDVVSSGPLWCSNVGFQIQRITYGDPNHVYRVSGPDCHKEYWLNGIRISNERARELGAW